MAKKRFNFIIEEKVYKKFSDLCQDLAIVRSKHIENYMKAFIKKYKKEENQP